MNLQEDKEAAVARDTTSEDKMPGEDLVCRVSGCTLGPDGGPYVTNKECTSYASKSSDLRLHLDMDHPGWSNGETKSNEKLVREKVETKIERPEIGEKCSDTEWQIFKAQWGRYLRATGLTGIAATHQLWACLPREVEIAMIHRGMAEVDDVDELLENIKALVVAKKARIVNRIEFDSMKQKTDESVENWRSRLNGISELCEFRIACSCGSVNSYKNEMVKTKLVAGLCDSSWKEKVLAQGDNLNLDKTMKFLDGLEMGRNSVKSLEEGKINKMSEYKASKEAKKPNYNKAGRSESSAKVGRKIDANKGTEECTHCGSKFHSDKLSERKLKCKAFDKKCHKCGKTGHFSSLC